MLWPLACIALFVSVAAYYIIENNNEAAVIQACVAAGNEWVQNNPTSWSLPQFECRKSAAK